MRAARCKLLAFGVVLVLVIILVPGGFAQLWHQLTAPRTARSTGAAARTADSTESTPSSSVQHTPTTGSRLAGLLEGADLPERGSPLLVVRDLTKRYGGVTALDHVDLDVAAGEIVALIGPNGAGKTTAFNIISGVLPPTSGTVTLRGREVQGQRPHVAASLGATRTFQNLQVFSSATVLGNVKVARHLRSRAGILRGLADWPDARSAASTPPPGRPWTRWASPSMRTARSPTCPSACSARSRSRGPSRWVRPSSCSTSRWPGSPDPSAPACRSCSVRPAVPGVAVLIVEHDVEAVLALADRVAVLDDGLLIAIGGPDEIRNDPAVIAAYLGVAAEDENLVRQAAARVEGEVKA